MDKKKVFKIATATTVAASALVSVAPGALAASTTTASKAVTTAEKDASKLKDQYNAKKLAYKKIDTATAVKSYKKAVAEVKKLKKGKTKTALENRLKSVKGIHVYAGNYNTALDLGAALATATKNVNDELKKAEFNLAAAKKDQEALKTATTHFTKHVVKGTVYGEGAREQLNTKYYSPAKTAATAVSKKVKEVEAELTDVKVAKAAVEALELAVKALKDDASVTTAEGLVAPAKAALAKVDTASEKKNLTDRIAAAEKAIADTKAELSDVKEAKAAVEALEMAVKALKDDATVKTADELVAPAKAALAKVDTDAVKKELTDKIAVAEKAIADKKAELAVPKVESVSAINAKTIKVTFSKELDKKSLKDAEDKDVINVVASEGATNAGTIAQELSEDGKTLTLSAANIFKGEYTVKVPFEIIKAVSGQFVSPVNQKVTADDKSAPMLTSAVASIKDTKDGLKKITLIFDEKVSSVDTVKINGVNYSAAVDGNKATVTVDLDATKSYDVTVVNATDAAGNVKDVQVAPLSVSVDNIAPSITSVVATGENKLKVTVDKELKDNTLDISGKVGTYLYNVVSKIEVNPENSKEYTLTLDKNYLFKSGNTDAVTLTVLKEKLVDTLGNTNASDITKTVTVSKDATAPGVAKVVTSTTEGKVTSFSVTYNEEVKNPELTKLSVVNSKGEILAPAAVVTKAVVSSEDAKTVVFTLANLLAVDKYSFDLAEGFVTDTALTANNSAKYAFSVDVTEAGKPVETSYSVKGAEAVDNVITVDFGTKVKATGTGSALNPSAYQVNGVSLPSDTKINFISVDGNVDQSKVEITLPEGFVKTNDAKAVFRVNAVQSLDNKVSIPFSKTVEITDNTAPEVKSVVATDLDQITVTYSEAIQIAADGNGILDEISLLDSKGVAVAFTDPEVTADGKLVLTVADSSKVSKLTTLTVGEAGKADIVDAQGNAEKAGLTISR